MPSQAEAVPLQAVPAAGQQPLFTTSIADARASDARVIPFDSLTTQADRESIRARAAELMRPAPLKTGKVEVRHARPRKNKLADQRRLDFQGQEEVLTAPESSIICDAPVAPARLRTEAALVDGALIALGCSLGILLFIFKPGPLVFDKHALPFYAAALATIPLFYKVLWAFSGRDTVGMRCAGLRLVDFDGNPPSQSRRYYRLAGSMLSLLAAGVGIIWSLVDEDGLTWHDHISGTFPTLASENYRFETS